jgi:hypothetical protein
VADEPDRGYTAIAPLLDAAKAATPSLGAPRLDAPGRLRRSADKLRKALDTYADSMLVVHRDDLNRVVEAIEDASK